MTAPVDLEAVRETWRAHWDAALKKWGQFTQLGTPVFFLSNEEAKEADFTQSFAMTRMTDKQVMINLAMLADLGLTHLPEEVLAHEVGHHVLCPATTVESAQMLARMMPNLPGVGRHAAMLANIYADLMINDRLQRSEQLRMVDVYAGMRKETQGPLWRLYMRMCEILWELPEGKLSAPLSKEVELAQPQMSKMIEFDAPLGARLVRVFEHDWLEGAGSFAALCRRYLPLISEAEVMAVMAGVCSNEAGSGEDVPDGIAGSAYGPSPHPLEDERITGLSPSADAEGEGGGQGQGTGQGEGEPMSPTEYAEILLQLGFHVTGDEATVRYYKDLARRYLVRFPTRTVADGGEPLPEALDVWEPGMPLESADWAETVMRSPVVVPGVTTVRRLWESSPGQDPERRPLDLDIYVDCSGSMPNPHATRSPLALAATILVMSALRAGARVNATLWSGRGQVLSTERFIRDEAELLKVVTGYIAGSTDFPIDLLRRMHPEPRLDRPAHIAVISDDGIDSMFRSTDLLGDPRSEVAAKALANAAGGGSLILNLPGRTEEWVVKRLQALATGWTVYPVSAMADLVPFARQFARALYGKERR